MPVGHSLYPLPAVYHGRRLSTLVFYRLNFLHSFFFIHRETVTSVCDSVEKANDGLLPTPKQQSRRKARVFERRKAEFIAFMYPQLAFLCRPSSVSPRLSTICRSSSALFSISTCTEKVTKGSTTKAGDCLSIYTHTECSIVVFSSGRSRRITRQLAVIANSLCAAPKTSRNMGEGYLRTSPSCSFWRDVIECSHRVVIDGFRLVYDA